MPVGNTNGSMINAGPSVKTDKRKGAAFAVAPAVARGRYPMPIASAATQTLGSVDPPQATGRYPSPVWATAKASSLASSDDILNLKEADYQEELGSSPLPQIAGQAGTTEVDNREIYQIIREVALPHSGKDLYSALQAQDGFGLCYGLVLFSQASGHLGKVLELMRSRDASTFQQLLGPASDELVATTTASTWEERLRPVQGDNLWSDKWQARFKAAGDVPAFQAAQNEAAIESQFRPMLNIAGQLGLDTDRTLAMAYDRVITRGLGGGLRWIMEVAGPLRDLAQQSFALNFLGFPNLRSFQNAAGLETTGSLNPETYGAIVASLRQNGCPMPSAQDFTGRMISAATGAVRTRLLRLRDSTVLQDVHYVIDGD